MCVKKLHLNLSPLFTNSLESSSLLTLAEPYYLSDKRNTLIEQKTVGALLEDGWLEKKES